MSELESVKLLQKTIKYYLDLSSGQIGVALCAILFQLLDILEDKINGVDITNQLDIIKLSIIDELTQTVLKALESFQNTEFAADYKTISNVGDLSIRHDAYLTLLKKMTIKWESFTGHKHLEWDK